VDADRPRREHLTDRLTLHVSERTVKRLTAALLRRLGVTTRTEAAALGGRSGLLDRPRS
jgi:hypothetical protein